MRTLTRMFAVLLCLLLGISSALFSACSDTGNSGENSGQNQTQGGDHSGTGTGGDSTQGGTGTGDQGGSSTGGSEGDRGDNEYVLGTPYNDLGEYDVTVPHVLINQVFGASDDAEYVSHSFIELYNPTSADVALNGWKLYYKSSQDGPDSGEWQSFTLSGSIGARRYYLIRCAAIEPVNAEAWLIPQGDAEWNIALHNKGLSVLLTSKEVTLGADFAGAVTAENRPEGYVDLLAAQGNDGEAEQVPPVYEGEYEDVQSKKKAVKREGFADTDNNKEDSAELAYDKVEIADKPVQNGSGETISAQPPEASSYTVKEDGFAENAALGMIKKGGITLGDPDKDGGVAEIIAYNSRNGKAYVVNGQASELNVFTVNDDGTFGEKTILNVKNLIEGKDPAFTYGDMTSVAVNAAGDRIAVALQDSTYTAKGRVAVLNAEDNTLAALYTVGVQPDMVVYSQDGRYILTADEGEPRMGYENGEDPAGTVSVIDTAADTVRIAGFGGFTAEELTEKGVILNKPEIGGVSTLLSPEFDLEPEYIAVRGGKAYVALQEANAIAMLDIESAAFENVFPLGFKDYGAVAVDLNEADGTYAPKTYENTYGVYMPDGISVYTAGGKTYVVTANEGDAREWEEFSDEAKVTLTATGGSTAEDVRALDKSVKGGLEEGKNYLYGGRSFSIFEVTDSGLELVFDSAGDFEAKTWEYLPEYYNVSNDDTELESRTAKKGTEPEAVVISETDGRIYAFIALERIGGIMVYDVTDPENAEYVNYINTRDFNDALTGDVAPEGLAVAVKGDKIFLLAAFEVSGTAASYELITAA